MVRQAQHARGLAIGLGLFLAMSPGLAAAAIPLTSCEQQPACQRQLIAGLVDLDQGAVESAVTMFESAYALSASPRLWLHIAHAYEQKGESEQAVTAYGRYLKEAPLDAPERQSVVIAMRELILQSASDDQQAEAAEPQPLPTKEELPECPAGKRGARARKAALALFGVGSGGLVPGIVLSVLPESPAVAGSCMDGYRPSSCRLNLKDAGIALLSVSGLSFAVATTLLAWSARASQEPRTTQCTPAR